jgi:hypothetical protein
MSAVFGVMVFKKSDPRGFASLLAAFHTPFCLSSFFALLRFFALCLLPDLRRTALLFLIRGWRCE